MSLNWPSSISVVKLGCEIFLRHKSEKNEQFYECFFCQFTKEYSLYFVFKLIQMAVVCVKPLIWCRIEESTIYPPLLTSISISISNSSSSNNNNNSRNKHRGIKSSKTSSSNNGTAAVKTSAATSGAAGAAPTVSAAILVPSAALSSTLLFLRSSLHFKLLPEVPRRVELGVWASEICLCLNIRLALTDILCTLSCETRSKRT